MTGRKHADIGDFLDHHVYPALFERLDIAFPEYEFERYGNRWVAKSDATRNLPREPRPLQVQCYRDRPWGLVIRGGDLVRFLELVNGGKRPTAAEFPAAVRTLAERGEVPFPEREISPGEAERSARRNARRCALQTVIALCRKTLADTRNVAADLIMRGLNFDAQAELELGIYPPLHEVEAALRAAGHDVDVARVEGLLFEPMVGCLVFPWADVTGQPMTLYGQRYPHALDSRRQPMALPGEDAAASPLYFDRALRAGRKDLVLVDYLVGAAVPQAMGEAGVVACMDPYKLGAGAETLARHGVRSVTMCLDAVRWGKLGTLACIHGLCERGIRAYVAPAFPENMDPHEFIYSHRAEAWRGHVAKAEHAFCHKARSIVMEYKRQQWGEGWRRSHVVACLDEAVAFDAGIHDPDQRTDLAVFFWPEIQRATGADMEAITERVESARRDEKARRQLKECEAPVGDADASVGDGDQDRRDREQSNDDADRHRFNPPRFSRMGGVGTLVCDDCGEAYHFHSFTHGVDGHSSGYQCQTCGDFTTRDYEQPFAENSREWKLEFAKNMSQMIEKFMQEYPRTTWLPTWETSLAEYREQLRHVSDEELAYIERLRDEVNAKHAASLVCECGGRLDRDSVVFCPNCGGEKLSYAMEYIT